MSSKPVMSVRHAILVLLSEGPKSGQQLCEELEARTGKVWPVNVDQVYATLRRLERDGLLTTPGPGGRGSRPSRAGVPGSPAAAPGGTPNV
jgi:DNA-binding PadR family transcriptional regulator